MSPEKILKRVQVALAFCKAEAAIVATSPGCWPSECVTWVWRREAFPGVVVVYLDRLVGAVPQSDAAPLTKEFLALLKPQTSCAVLAVRDSEVEVLSAVELNALVARRLAAALQTFRPLGLAETDDRWVGPAVEESLAQ